MKKLLIVFMMLGFLAPAFAKVDSAKGVVTKVDTNSLTAKQVYNDLKSGTKDMSKDIKTALQSLGETLKVGSEHVYTVLVKQQIVWAIVYFLLLVFGIVALTLGYKFFGKTEFDGEDLKKGRVLDVIITVISFLGGLILVLIGIFHIPDMVTGFVNPEYGAMNDIVDWIKKMTGK